MEASGLHHHSTFPPHTTTRRKASRASPKRNKKSTQRDPRPNASILCSFLFSAARPQPLPTNRRCPRLACRLPAPALSMRQPRSVHFRSIRWRLLTNRFDIALCPGNARPGTRARTNASYRLSLHNTALKYKTKHNNKSNNNALDYYYTQRSPTQQLLQQPAPPFPSNVAALVAGMDLDVVAVGPRVLRLLAGDARHGGVPHLLLFCCWVSWVFGFECMRVGFIQKLYVYGYACRVQTNAATGRRAAQQQRTSQP